MIRLGVSWCWVGCVSGYLGKFGDWVMGCFGGSLVVGAGGCELSCPTVLVVWMKSVRARGMVGKG